MTITLPGKGQTMRRAIGIGFLLAYIGCVFGANWAGEKFGIVSIGFGLHGPAGLYFVGLAFVLRDFTQDTLGRKAIPVAVIVGAALSYFVAPSFALASGVAFLLSEALDFAVYTPLRDREWGLAVLLSSVAGALVDSVVFLWIAFGWDAVGEFWFGQTVGKVYMALPFVLGLWGYRSWRALDRRPETEDEHYRRTYWL
jgi:hypothetical protein